MPAHEYDSKLRAVLSYYYSVVNVTPEGDSLVSGEKLHGLGTDDSSRSLLHDLFGSLLRVASPATYWRGPPEPSEPPLLPSPLPSPSRPDPDISNIVEELLHTPPEETTRMEDADNSTQVAADIEADDQQQALQEAFLRKSRKPTMTPWPKNLKPCPSEPQKQRGRISN